MNVECSVVKSTLLSDVRTPTAIAWGANGNLIAVAAHPEIDVARVMVLEPDALHEYEVLELAVDRDDAVAFLSFSPVQAPLTLLMATKKGKTVLWMPRPLLRTKHPLTVNTWSSCKVDVPCKEWIVCKFLSAASSFRWPPRNAPYDPTASSGIPLEKRFFAVDHVVMGDQPWLRTGMLHFILLDTSGSFYVSWKTLDGWVMTQAHALSEVLSGRLLCADVIAGCGSSLRMTVVSDTNPVVAALLDIRGHPRPAHDNISSFNVEVLGMLRPSIEHPISAVQFRPDALGNALVMLQSSCDSVAVSKHVPSTSDSDIFTESKRLVLKLNTEPLDESAVKKVSMKLSPDGACLALYIPGSSPVLLSLGNLYITDRLGSTGDVICGVFSPNGVAFAALSQHAPDSKLEIWSLPESSIGINKVPENAKAVSIWDSMRLAWCMLSNTDPWDICQRIRCHSTTLPEMLKYYSLFYIDSMLHRHPHEARPQFADMLDRIKIRILQHVEHQALKAVLIDLYVRRMVMYHLFHGFKATFLMNCSPSSTGDFMTENLTEADKETCRVWVNWLGNFFNFFCQCIKTWINTASMSTECTVPFIRLFSDHNFLNRLSVLVHQFRHTMRSIFPPSLYQEKAQIFAEFMAVLRQIHELAKPDKNTEDPEPSEEIEAFRSMVAQIQRSLKGPVHLHYARLSGPNTQGVLDKIGRYTKIKGAAPLDALQIERRAVELGLMPDRALKGFLITREQAHRQPYPPQQQPARLLPMFDCITGKRLTGSRPIFFAVDQSCCANIEVNDQVIHIDIDTTEAK